MKKPRSNDIVTLIMGRLIPIMPLPPGVDRSLLMQAACEKAYIELAKKPSRTVSILDLLKKITAAEGLRLWQEQVYDFITSAVSANPRYPQHQKSDLISLVFEKVETGLPDTYDPTRTSWQGYVRGVIGWTHIEMTSVRQKGGRRQVSLDKIADQLTGARERSDPLHLAMQRELSDNLKKAFAAACHDDLDRAIVALMFLDFGPTDIAIVLGEPKEKIKKRCRRLIERVRKSYHPDE